MTPSTPKDTQDEKDVETPDGVATPEENAELQHSAGGETTRDDALDAGVPMIEGHPSEPVGPEDALGIGLKRGDYTTRVGDNHAESVPLEGGGEPIYAEDGVTVVDYKPAFGLQDQTKRTEDIGDAPGLKGGVDTATTPAPAAVSEESAA